MTNSLTKVLITGGHGQLASALLNHPLAQEFQLVTCAHTELDITDANAISNTITKFMPHIIINTAAYTAVDKAESDIVLADQVNHLGANNLARECEEHHIPLIHISTDYVFDGTKQSAYLEEDATNPINHYGKSKWLGEEAVRKHCKQHLILRVSGIFSEYKTNFFKTMLKLEQNKTNIRVVVDQITCPTYASDIAEAIFLMAKKLGNWGTYHYCSAPAISWHQFAESILNRPLQAITTAEYPTAAKRPAYSVLDCNKIAAVFGIKQPSWQEAIRKLL